MSDLESGHGSDHGSDEKTGIQPTVTERTVHGVKVNALKPLTTEVSFHFDTAPKEHEEGDIAMQFAHNIHEGQKVPPDIRKRLERKSYLYLFLFIGWCYCLQFADKTVVSIASQLGLRSSTVGINLTGSQYSWVGSAFYFGYLGGILPMVYLLQRFPVSKVTSACYMAWAIILTCTAGCQNYAGMIALRVLLGFFESVISPAFTVITTQWFPRDEHFSLICFWFGFNGFGTILAASIGIGVLDHESYIDGGGWRTMFLIFGLMTFATAVAFFFHIPDTPVDAWFLTDEERTWQIELIREKNGSVGYGTRKFKWYQVKEAILDPATYLAGFYVFLADVPNGASTNFSTIIIEGLGFDTVRQSFTMSLPTGGTEFVGCILTSIVARFIFKKTRMLWAILSGIGSIFAYCFLAWGKNTGMRLFGNYSSAWFAPVMMIAALSNIGSNCGGYTKRLFTMAFFFMCYAAGNIVGPQTFKSDQEPDYPTGKESMAATDIASVGLLSMLFLLNIWRNWRRNRKNEQLPEGIENPEFADLTDLENPTFRYAM